MRRSAAYMQTVPRYGVPGQLSESKIGGHLFVPFAMRGMEMTLLETL